MAAKQVKKINTRHFDNCGDSGTTVHNFVENLHQSPHETLATVHFRINFIHKALHQTS